MAPTTWKDTITFPHIACLILLFLTAAFLHHTFNNGEIVSLENLVILKENKTKSTKNSGIKGCNLFSGRWVYDNISYPLYRDTQCSFMDELFACEKNGRKDLKYQNWRWQPQHCDLPRFNSRAFLEKIRGKKLLFVGDSLNRNTWQSLLCLIESNLSNKSVTLIGNLWYLRSMEYNTTIGFYWAPFLVESNHDNIHRHPGKTHREMDIKSIEKHGRHWLDADILVFDSFVWWLCPDFTILWGSFKSPIEVYGKEKLVMRAYEIALNTWSDWLEMQINRTKTRIFFMSFSPFRLGSIPWQKNDMCYKETEPVHNEAYWPSGVNKYMMRIAESSIAKLEERGLKVEYLNITQLSGYREDAHPSVYSTMNKKVDWKLKNPKKYSDCLHWCLPGVPDVWNQILYAYIMKLVG